MPRTTGHLVYSCLSCLQAGKFNCIPIFVSLLQQYLKNIIVQNKMKPTRIYPPKCPGTFPFAPKVAASLGGSSNAYLKFVPLL